MRVEGWASATPPDPAPAASTDESSVRLSILNETTSRRALDASLVNNGSRTETSLVPVSRGVASHAIRRGRRYERDVDGRYELFGCAGAAAYGRGRTVHVVDVSLGLS